MKIWENMIKLQIELTFDVREYFQLYFSILNDEVLQISNKILKLSHINALFRIIVAHQKIEMNRKIDNMYHVVFS